jgi:hypothetical protein
MKNNPYFFLFYVFLIFIGGLAFQQEIKKSKRKKT